MDFLNQLGFVALCLFAPVAWGLFMEWLFHRVRLHRQARRSRRRRTHTSEMPL